MKRVLFYLIVWTFAVPLYAYEQSEKIDAAENIQKTITPRQDTVTYSLLDDLKAGFESWKAQLDFVRQGGHKGVLDSSDLSLISFTALESEKHPSLKEFKEMPVNIQVGRRDDSGIPVINKISEKSRIAKYYRILKSGIINYYDSLEVDPELRLVQLEWKYQDTTFHTYCVVSETLDAFIYDDVLSNIFIVTNSSGREAILEAGKTISGDGDDYLFGDVLTVESPIGSILAKTSATIRVGRQNHEGELAIIDYAYDNQFKSMPFWEATGKSNVVTFEKGKNGRVVFAYEIGAKYGVIAIDGKNTTGATWGRSSTKSISPSTSSMDAVEDHHQ